MHDMLDRKAIGDAAMARFQHQPFAYGKNDCARLAAFVLRRRGHAVQLAKAGSYRTALGAKRGLERAGYETLADAIDAIGLPRIAPAAALPCDLVLIPGGESFGGAITIAVGNGRVLGYHEDIEGADVLQPVEFVAAWRV